MRSGVGPTAVGASQQAACSAAAAAALFWITRRGGGSEQVCSRPRPRAASHLVHAQHPERRQLAPAGWEGAVEGVVRKVLQQRQRQRGVQCMAWRWRSATIKRQRGRYILVRFNSSVPRSPGLALGGRLQVGSSAHAARTCTHVHVWLGASGAGNVQPRYLSAPMVAQMRPPQMTSQCFVSACRSLHRNGNGKATTAALTPLAAPGMGAGRAGRGINPPAPRHSPQSSDCRRPGLLAAGP